MAENKREDWQVERDREEIMSLLVRHRRISHQKIAEILNARRVEEYRHALTNLDTLEDDAPIPDVQPPYTLTRQMIDYDIKAIRKEWKKSRQEKFDQHKDYQLAQIEELARAAWDGYERSQRVRDEMTTSTSNIETQVGIEEVLDENRSDKEKHDLRGPRGGKLRFTVPATRNTTTRKREQLLGDPRFLLVVDRALERREKLLGLEPPKTVNVNVQKALAELLGVSPDSLPAEDSNDSNHPSDTPHDDGSS